MKVLLGIPTGGHFHWRLVPTVVDICKQGAELYISQIRGNEANRNHITKDVFLKGDYTHPLMLDTDQIPTFDPMSMLKHDKDVMSMPTILGNRGGFLWSVYDKDTTPGYLVSARTERGEGIEKVHAVSTGCILIKREVLENMEHPFSPHRNEDDQWLVTQDILFCDRVNEAGYEVWVDWEHPCRHFKEVDLLAI